MQLAAQPIQNTPGDVLWALFKAFLIFGVSAFALYVSVLVAFYTVLALVHAFGSTLRAVWHAILARATAPAAVRHEQIPVKTKPRLRLVKG